MKLAFLHDLPRPVKRAIVLAADTALIPIALYAACALRYGTGAPWRVMDSATYPLFPMLTLLGIAVLVACRLPWIKLGTFEHRAVVRIATAAALLSLLAMGISYTLALPAPRSVPLIFGAVFLLSSFGLRLAGQQILAHAGAGGGMRTAVAIYGAGAAGIQLAAALRQAREARPVMFIDDNPHLQGLMVAGLPVYPPRKLDHLIARHRIERILLAMPSIGDARRDQLLQALKPHGIETQILPSYVDMMSGRGLAEQLRTVTPDALLGRDKVDLNKPEIAKAYAGRVVMVTGAGGSIGSELCRQLLDCKPARIVLFDQGEYALYDIDRSLRARAEKAGIPVSTRLGSVTNAARVSGVIVEDSVEIILHAAAYKHVPLVEVNELEGARNNVLGTRVVAEAALAHGLERFILISTDKAVRPTNVMGATKRMAELVVQDLQTRSSTTKFAMVRFGNVLGSSGSVLPLFQKQIEAGGPVTVTHPDVTRFFMTIPEAARLVLLAGAFAEGGDVFVLDMGQPQRILDIAHRMIALSGRRVKDSVTGEGDIAIEITGLRPGEKLYEELLIDDASLTATPHPKILRAEEAMLSEIEIVSMLRELQACITEADALRLRRLIEKRVDGYHRQGATRAV
jgi:FlaA1/EpsC-like NDP-sugar epimerase